MCGGDFKWSVMPGTKEEMKSEPSTACVSFHNLETPGHVLFA